MKLVEAERPQDEICFQKMIILTFEVIVQPTHNFSIFSLLCRITVGQNIENSPGKKTREIK